MGNNQIKIGAVLGYVNYAVKMAVQLLYVPIMLRILGQSEYGVYQLVASMITYLSLLNFGFGGAYLRFYAQHREDRKQEASLNGTFLIVFVFFAFLAVIAGSIMTYNAEVLLGNKLKPSELGLAKVLFAILTVNMATTFPGSVFTSIISSREKFLFLRLTELVRSIISPFLIITMLLLGYGSIGMAIATTLIAIGADMINIWYVFVKLKAPFSLRYFDKNLVKEIGAFSFFIFLNSVIDQINWNVDKYLLGRFVGAVAIAVYSVAAQINTIYIQISDMLATVLAPKVNVIAAEESDPMPHLNKLFFQVGRLQSYIVYAVLFGFMIFGKEFIGYWAGPGYELTYYVTLLLIVPVSIPLCQTLGVDIQRALDKHQYRSLVYAVVAIMNLLVSIPLTKRFGAVGAAAGTTISLLIGNGLIMNILYEKMIGLKVIEFWKQIVKNLPAVMVPSMIVLVVRWFITKRSMLLFVAEGLLFIGVYVVSLYKIAMNQQEKTEVQRIIKKIKRT